MAAHARTEELVGEWKVTITADALPPLFAEVARLIARACGRAQGEPGEWEHIALAAPDNTTLLADWANELIGLSEVTGRAYDEVRWDRLEDGALDADVRGRPVAAWRSPLKAATYHGLELEQWRDRWRGIILFDV